MTRVRWFALLALAVALVAGGCGSDDEEGSGSGSGAQKQESSASGGGGSTVEVGATEFKFDPANPKVAKAGKVKFELTNKGQAPHALEVEGPRGEVETKTIEGGESASVTADLSKPGSYTMYCPVGNHRQQGMEGKVVVAADGSGSSADKGSDDDSAKGAGGY
jgi:plastocyanin